MPVPSFFIKAAPLPGIAAFFSLKEDEMANRNEKLIPLLVEFWKSNRTQKEFSGSVGMGYSTFNGILSGRIVPTPEEKRKISDGLGVEVTAIFPRK